MPMYYGFMLISVSRCMAVVLDTLTICCRLFQSMQSHFILDDFFHTAGSQLQQTATRVYKEMERLTLQYPEVRRRVLVFYQASLNTVRYSRVL